MPKFVPNSNLVAAIVPVVASAFVFNQISSNNPELKDKINNLPIIRETNSVLGIKTTNTKNLVRQSDSSGYEEPNYDFYDVLADTDTAIMDTTTTSSSNNNQNTNSVGGTVTYTKPEFTEEDKGNFLTYVIENFQRIGNSYDISFNKLKLQGREDMPLTGDLDEDEGFIWADKDIDKLYLTGQGGTKTEILTKGIFSRNIHFKKNITISKDLTVKQNVSVIGNFSGATATLSSAYLTGNLTYLGNLNGGTATLGNTRINGDLTTTGNFSGTTATLSSAYFTGNLTYLGNLNGGTATLGNTRINGDLTATGNFSGTTATLSSMYISQSINLPFTTSANVGVIYKNGSRFIHNFQHPTGGGAIPSGNNTFIGEGAGNFTMGETATETQHSSNNIGIGNLALYNNTTGYQNNALGNLALVSNTTGYQNNALGYQALYNNTTGYQNNALGNSALRSNTTGYQNNALGNSALRSNTTGYENNALGNSALYSNTTGYQNNALGNWALFYNTTGYKNNAFGVDALRNNISGNRNLALGDFAGVTDSFGVSITNPENSIFIGYRTRSLGQGEDNQIVIGNEAIGAGSNSVVLGNDSILKTILKGNLGLGTTSPTYKLDVKGSAATTDLYLTQLATGAGSVTLCRNASTGLVGQCTSARDFKTDIKDLGLGLSEVMELRPVKFDWKDGSGEDFGFIAEEVYKVNPLLAEYSTDGAIAGVRYRQLTALLANAVKEQQVQFEGLSSAIGNLNVTQMQNIYDQFVEVAENLSMSTENGSLVINSKLVVTGEALFNNATFTGNVNVGQVKIDSLENDISIDTASCVDMDGNLNEEACETNKLSIMNNKAGNVEFFDGKANINPKGEILGEKVEAKSFKSATSSAPESSETCSPKEFKFGEEGGKAYIFYCTSESKWVRTELNNY